MVDLGAMQQSFLSPIKVQLNHYTSGTKDETTTGYPSSSSNPSNISPESSCTGYKERSEAKGVISRGGDGSGDDDSIGDRDILTFMLDEGENIIPDLSDVDARIICNVRKAK